MCKKHKKLTLILGLFVFSSLFSACSWLQEDKKWRNHLKEEVINGVKNPYMVDEGIYNYIATNLEASKNDNIYYDLCQFEVFSLDSTNRVGDLKSYLNKFSSNKLRNHPESHLFLVDKGELVSKWLHNKEITQNLFSSFDEKLMKDKIFSQKTFDRYIECLNFFRNNDNEFLKKYGLNFIEETRYDDFDKNKAVEVIKNPNSLVKINLWRYTGGFVYFYDSQQKYLILLTFQPSS